MAFTGKQGWLYKQGGKRKTWKQRYFVLSFGTFAYYSSKGVRGGWVSAAVVEAWGASPAYPLLRRASFKERSS